MARVQRARARACRGPEPPAARARQVPRHLREQPRRVLHGAGRRPQAAHRHRHRGQGRQRLDAPRGARGHLRQEHGPHAAPGRALPRPDRARARGRGHRGAPLGRGVRGRARPAHVVLQEQGVPGPHAARGRPGAPVPLHLRALAQPRRRRPQPLERHRAVRPRQGAADPRALRRRRPPALRPSRGHHRRAPRRAVPRHGGAAAPHLPRHAQRGPRGRGGRRREPPAGARARAHAPPLRPARPARGHAVDRPPRPRPADPRARHRQRGGRPDPRAPRPHRALGRRPAAARRPQAAGLPAPDEPRAHRRRYGVGPRRARGHARPRRAAAPPVRRVLDERAALPRAGRDRPEGPRDQADALPHQRRLADRGRPRGGGRGGQAGPRDRRDQGALRRAGQHRLGAQARAGRAATWSTAWSA